MQSAYDGPGSLIRKSMTLSPWSPSGTEFLDVESTTLAGPDTRSVASSSLEQATPSRRGGILDRKSGWMLMSDSPTRATSLR
eukprot:2817156-Rhodomonas_salina.1